MTTTLLWTLQEAARQLGGLSIRTVRRMQQRGDLPAVRIGRRVMVPVEAARAWVEDNVILAQNLECAGSDVRKEDCTCRSAKPTEMASINEAIRRTGGPATRMQAAVELGAQLGKPIRSPQGKP